MGVPQRTTVKSIAGGENRTPRVGGPPRSTFQHCCPHASLRESTCHDSATEPRADDDGSRMLGWARLWAENLGHLGPEKFAHRGAPPAAGAMAGVPLRAT